MSRSEVDDADVGEGFDAPSPSVHLLKLCVGAESIEDLGEWQAERFAERKARGEDPRPRHVTRMWPRRAGELLKGGSLFWVVRGVISVRQRIERLEPVTGADGISRCAIVLAPPLVRVVPRPQRAFQGWRYLAAKDAPADLSSSVNGDDPALPQHLAEALAALGVLGR